MTALPPKGTSPGAAVRAARLARGWSQPDVAARVVRARQAYRLPAVDAESLRQQINGMETGRRPIGPQWRSLLAEALDTSEEYLFGITVESALPRPLLLEVGATEAKVQQIRAQRDIHTSADHMFGPRYAKDLVDVDLNTVEGLLRNATGQLVDPIRVEAARMAELGGWLAQDGGDIATAERLTARAEDYARRADPAIRALITMRRSNVAYQRDPALAVDLAAEAARLLPRRGHDRLAASIKRQQAISALAAKDINDFTRHINRAGDLSQAPPEDADLATYAHVAYIASERAAGLLVLRRPEEAAELLRAHLPLWPETQQRDHAVALARMARALTATGDHSGAIDAIAATKAAYREAPSVRTRRELRMTRRLIISQSRTAPRAPLLANLQQSIYDVLQGDPPDA